MFTQINYPSRLDYAAICQRPALEQGQLDALISDVFSQVKSKGDQALRELTATYEKREITDILYTAAEMEDLASKTDITLQKAIDHAYANIYTFHAAQKLVPNKIEINPGVVCWQKSTGIDKVGIYIPGGTAPLFSTVLMLAIPARIAECQEVVLCTPATHPAIFYAAKLCGVTKMAKVGGSQAIAALSLGTESVPAVYKIFGPGNQYVTAAKMYANRLGTAIDMPAGPSEVAVYADQTANPAYIASDLLSQAEHGSDSQVILVSTSYSIVEETIAEINLQLAELPRKDLAEKALANSKFVLVNTSAEAIDLLNEYAAEHLILACDNAEGFADHIRNAGSIFLGHYTPESAGDYASGTNHTLPTNGFARAYSGVNLDSFTKKITLQSISKQGLEQLGKTIIDMAEAESLQAHANAVKIRLS
ncbi:histidinol dehydrogenase [Aquirufa sp. KTFRIE-69F]|uniref:Histidinol dehydrogenase n=1 Tax=Aquirufa originis TaxID=3096514 RepID=A0ABW6D5U0_9BACT